MVRVGLEGWSVWIVYVLVGTMQVVLIVLAISFAFRDRRLAKEGKRHCSVPQEFEGWDTVGPWASRSRQASIQSHLRPDIAPDEQSPLIQRPRSPQKAANGHSHH